MKESTGSPSSCLYMLNLALLKITFLFWTKWGLNCFGPCHSSCYNLKVRQMSSPSFPISVLTSTSCSFWSSLEALQNLSKQFRPLLRMAEVELLEQRHLVQYYYMYICAHSFLSASSLDASPAVLETIEYPRHCCRNVGLGTWGFRLGM